MFPQLQQWRQAEFGEKGPLIGEAIIDSTVPPLVEGHVRRTAAPVGAKALGALAERQPADVFTAPDQTGLGVGLVFRTKSVLERRIVILAMSGAEFGDPHSCPVDRLNQFLPTVMKLPLQGQVAEASHKEGTLIPQPPTLGSAKSPHGSVNVETRHGHYT